MGEEIKKTRNKLDCIIKNKGLDNEKVLRVSKELDLLILEYYRKRKRCNLKV